MKYPYSPTTSLCNIYSYRGSVGYFMGGCAYCAMFYSNQKIQLSMMTDLLHATKRIHAFQQGVAGRDSRETLAKAVMRRTVMTRRVSQGLTELAAPAHTMLRNTAFTQVLRHTMRCDEESQSTNGHDLMGPVLRTNLMQRGKTSFARSNTSFCQGKATYSQNDKISTLEALTSPKITTRGLSKTILETRPTETTQEEDEDTDSGSDNNRGKHVPQCCEQLQLRINHLMRENECLRSQLPRSQLPSQHLH